MSFLVSLVLLPVPACGQREFYGDDEMTNKHTALYAYCVYKTSTIEGAAKDVLYDMWRMCEKELGKQPSALGKDTIPFRVDFMKLFVDYRGRIRYLVLFASRRAETKDENARMEKLLKKLKRMRFPPFDHLYDMMDDADIDSVWFGRTLPRPKGNVSREEYEWW